MATSRRPVERRHLRVVPQAERRPAVRVHPVSRALLWFGVAGGPVAWAIDRLAFFYFASAGCHSASPGYASVSRSSMQTPELAVTLVTGLVALAAGIAAWWMWQQTRRPEDEGTALDTSGRTPFWALGGMLLSLVFLAAIAVTGGSVIALGGSCH